MSSGWFNPTEPPQTAELQREDRIISHEFGGGCKRDGGLSRFEGTEPPRTHVKLTCRFGSLSQTVVRAGLKA